MAKRRREIIVVRSLKESDLGLFAAHRASATSKQRAININSKIAGRILSPSAFRSGGFTFDCYCTFGNFEDRSPRNLGKSHKNWRLGGNKFEGKEFAVIDSLDFALLRSIESNDGSLPLSMTFIARSARASVHARIVAMVSARLKQSMALYEDGDDEFRYLASLCPLAPLKRTEK